MYSTLNLHFISALGCVPMWLMFCHLSQIMGPQVLQVSLLFCKKTLEMAAVKSHI